MPIPAGSILPLLSDLKEHLDIQRSVHDAELQGMLDAAVELVEGYVGPLDGVTTTETHYAVSRSLPLVLRRSPVLSVASVTDSYGNAYSGSDWTLDGPAGLLHLSRTGGAFGHWSGDVTVTYTAGRATLPTSVRMAILIVAADLWSTQRGNAPSALPVPDEAGSSTGPNALPAVPPRAYSLMQPYLLGPSVA